MGTRTDAALEALVAARADFDTEVDRLEAAGRAAVDVPAKVRANPAKAGEVSTSPTPIPRRPSWARNNGSGSKSNFAFRPSCA